MSNKTEYIPFRCSPRLKARLEQVAKSQEITLSEVIRLACEDYTSPKVGITVPIVGTISDKGIEWKSSEVRS